MTKLIKILLCVVILAALLPFASGAAGNTWTWNGVNYTLPGTDATIICTSDTGSVTNTMLAGSIAASKLTGTDIATVGTVTAGTWSATALVAAKLPNAGVMTGDATTTFPALTIVTISGSAATLSNATTPSLTTNSGATNTGFFQVNGKTSGALKITAADATAQTVTLTTAAQTVGASTLTIADLKNVSGTVVTGPSAGPILFAGPTAGRTITVPDAAFTVARTDAANTFTGVQTMTSPSFTTPVLGTPTSGTLTTCTGYTTANLSGTITNAQLAGSIDLTTKVTGQLPYANGGEKGSAATTATTGTMTVSMTTAVITITPTNACTFNASGGLTGQLATFAITTSGVSSFTLTWGTNYKTTATLATGTTSGKVFTVTFRCIDGTAWWEVARTTAM